MRHGACILAFVLLAGCQQKEEPAPSERVEPTPMPVSVEQFRSLAWLEGRWRGTLADTMPFFERYQFQDDSTMGTWTFADSLRTQVSDSGWIRLRNGTVTSGDSARGYVLTALDSASAHFKPRGAASNAFTWRKTSDSSWTATLTWRDRSGQAMERIYVMRLLGR